MAAFLLLCEACIAIDKGAGSAFERSSGLLAVEPCIFRVRTLKSATRMAEKHALSNLSINLAHLKSGMTISLDGRLFGNKTFVDDILAY